MKNEDYQKLFHTALESTGKLLKGYSNFHTYSFGNQLWAMGQMLWAGLEVSPIATYKKWASLGRQVQRGSKAITLYMPVQVEDKNKTDGSKKTIFIARPKWFAMSQTEGEDVTFPEIGYDYEKALQTLEVTRKAFDHIDGNVQGFARKGEIAINPIAELPQKTFFHELAHVLLHLEGDVEFVDDKTSERNLKEVEAEGVALFCSLALGLTENVEYCVGYIKSWNKDNEIPVDSIKRIFRAADKILKAGQEKLVAGEA